MINEQILSTGSIRGNITSSLDISQDQTFFTAVTRLRAQNSSMYSYQLQLFNLATLKQISLTHIYDTYSQLTHPCKILPKGNTIVVATKYHIIFYDNKLKIKHKILHHQLDINDLSYSPDSKLINMVGTNSVLIWDTSTFKSINFPFLIQDARSSKYSPNNKYLAVASTSKISFYQIQPIGDTYTFILHPQYQIDNNVNSTIGLVSFTSFDFNPINSYQIVIGFSSGSPRIYNFYGNNSGYTKISSEDQPYSLNNFKIVKFMPDGKRVFSSDYLHGVGLWPGSPTQPLLYKQNFLFFGPTPYQGGTKILGYNWQTIQVAEIQFQCKPGSSVYSVNCRCGAEQFWSLTAKSCQNCIQQTQNICKCSSNSHFDANLQRCVYDCQKQENTIALITDSNDGGIGCFCDRGYFWEDDKCTFNCSNIIFSIGPSSNSTSTCQCSPGFTWNDKSKTCSCSQNSQLLKQNTKVYCSCLPNYQIDTNTKLCMPVCSNITNSIGTDLNGNCTCQEGYIFKVTDNLTQINQINNQEAYKNNSITIISSQVGGCFRNCSMYNFTQGQDDKDGCICRENMDWNASSNQCSLNCSKIINAGNLITQNGTQSCSCASHYSWIPQNIQCGRSCDNISNVNKSKYSTTISCPCQNKFDWSQAYDICIINCTRVNYSQSYQTSSKTSCACRTNFYWSQSDTSCIINCSLIWNAKQRVADGECSCGQDQKFNKTSLSCYTSSQNAFSQPWIWALLGVGGLFLVIVAFVLLKFCWNYAVNNENKKKLKKNTQQRGRKKKQMNMQMNIPTTERFAIDPT